MKRVFTNTAALLLCMCFLFGTASAFDGVQTERIDYEDGSYAIITTVTGGLTRASKADSKTYTYYNPSHQLCFSYTLYATFTYNGITSSADTATARADYYVRGWSCDSHSEYTSGNAAYGTASFSGPNGESRPVSLSLVCDRNGTVK